jgi:hypothetical protein
LTPLRPTARRVTGPHDLFADRPPDLFISGHVHQSRELRVDGTDHIWVPTTWAVLPDRAQPVLGTKRSGVLSLTFAAGVAPQPTFCEPEGLRQPTVTEDIPDRYHGR